MRGVNYLLEHEIQFLRWLVVRWGGRAAWLVVSILLVSPARATVGPPVKIRMPVNTRQAESGRAFHGVFEVDVRQAGVVSDVKVSGKLWKVHSVEVPAAVVAANVGTLRIPFHATPGDADELIELSLKFDGRLVNRAYRIGPKAFAERGRARRTVQAVPGVAAAPPAALVPGTQDALNITPQGGAIGLRFVGRFAYDRPTGLDSNNMPTGTSVEGVDGIWVRVMDEDTVDSETIWSGYTDVNGYFDTGNISWDDCDISGCDEPDIYVIFECDTMVVNVQDGTDILEHDYTWDNIDNVVDDFTGNFYDFGTIKPSNASEMPACHIHNSITRAHRYILNKSGTGIHVSELDLLWPDGSNASYDPGDTEISIGPVRQWNEGSHTHEYGHHFLEKYSVNVTPDYCNNNNGDPNFCDDASGVPGCYGAPTGSCGHCQWCRETDHDAWNEGWPNWLADLVTRDYPLTYQFSNGTPWMALIPRSQEALGMCCQDGQIHDALRTEGFVGALLRDIEDGGTVNGVNQQDDHDGGTCAGGTNDGTPCTSNANCTGGGVCNPLTPCAIDAMWLGPEEIFTVVVVDKPSTVAQFITDFRARYPLEDQDFWSTTRNVAPEYGFPLPTPQPSLVSNGCSTYRAGQRIELTVNGGGSLMRYQWRRNLVNLSSGGRISGADGPTLVIDPAEAGDGGAYSCLVSTCDNTLSYPTQPIYIHVFPAATTGMAALGFGANYAGQTGRGSSCGANHCAYTPAPVVNLANFADISGYLHCSAAVTSDGSAWGWGDNSFRQATGNPSSPAVLVTPTFIPQLSNMVSIDAGYTHSAGLRADGKVFCWGDNFYFSLGVNNQSQTAPVNPTGLDCMIDVQVGQYYTISLGADGQVWAWGYNANGNLGRGFTSGPSPTPLPVLNLSNVIAIAAGTFHNLALKSDGTVWSWGYNATGQLGDGTTTQRTSPVQITGLSSVVAINAGPNHSMAVLADGSARVWGAGGGYQLGNNAASDSPTPITPTGMGAGANVTAISGGSAHTFFLKGDRTLWACGANVYGQLAQPSYLTYTVPTQLAGLSDVRAIFGRGQTSFVFTPGVAPAFPFVLGGQGSKVGGVVNWTSPANGTPTITYQWKHGNTVLVNGGPISGATTSTLTINPVSLAHAGTYTCTATNGYGSVSHSDTLTVMCIDADFNCDEHVDANDVQVMADCETGPAIPGPPPGCTPQQFAAADYDNDGDVDMDDYGRFQRCIAGANQIPPPDCAQ